MLLQLVKIAKVLGTDDLFAYLDKVSAGLAMEGCGAD
jgi:hypothetical protein